jgi:hypothetical protein
VKYAWEVITCPVKNGLQEVNNFMMEDLVVVILTWMVSDSQRYNTHLYPMHIEATEPFRFHIGFHAHYNLAVRMRLDHNPVYQQG